VAAMTKFGNKNYLLEYLKLFQLFTHWCTALNIRTAAALRLCADLNKT